MFRTCHRLRLASQPHHGIRVPIPRRNLSSVANSFLDFATAIPYPTAFPPYSSTIILVTVLTRIALLPIATWVWEFTPVSNHRSNEITGKQPYASLPAACTS